MTTKVLSGKESAPLHQTTLLTALDYGTNMSKAGSRKRTLTLVNGDELDLGNKIPVTAEVVEAMKARIIQLEDELAAQPPAKRARTSAAQAEASSAPTASSSKAEEKKRTLQLKKIFDRLKKECKSDTVKFQGSPKSIRFEEVYEKTEFDVIFGGKGRLIQPTPQNKPKSAVTIIEYNSAVHIQDLFGNELKPLKGNIWSRGGVPVRAFGGGFGGYGSTFAKSVKQGAVDVSIRSLEVNYSKNNMKCTLKFEVAQDGGFNCFGYGDDDDSDY